MWVLLGAPWLLAGMLTWRMRWLADRFQPDWLLAVATGLAVALALSTCISVLAAAAVLITAVDGILHMVGVVLAVAAAYGVLMAARHGVRIWRSMRTSRDVWHRAAQGSRVLEIEDDQPDAFAVPGRGGGLIVLTTGLTAAMTAAERSVVIEHERAHLRRHHHRYVQALELAVCFNPFLGPWRAVVRLAAERSADEYAARGRRAVAARAVARAALLCARDAPATACHIASRPSEARTRVVALTRAAPMPQPRRLLVVAAVLVALVGAQAYLAADVLQDRLAPEPGEAASTVIG